MSARDPTRPLFDLPEPGTVRNVPLPPHAMSARITPTKDLFTLAHFGLGRIAPGTWSLEIEGLVRRPLLLRLEDLRRFPQVRLEAVHQCAGNPLEPEIPTRRVANVIWGGVRLAEVLAAAEPEPAANFAWSDGADAGEFAGIAAPFFRKDLPLARLSEDVLVATELNDEPLPDRHGGPARLVVPGFYGTNSVKWLWRITLADRRAEALFTTRFYNDRLPGGATRPVWALAPESIIVSPAPGAEIRGATEISGWTWADAPVVAVEISDDSDAGWQPAALEPRTGRAWQAWRCHWQPAAVGRVRLRCRARDANGDTQPEAGARNALHAIEVHALAA